MIDSPPFINITYKDNIEDIYIVTKYSLFHLLYGSIIALVFGTSNNVLFFSIILHLFFEYIENTQFGIWFFNRHTIWKHYTGDSLLNTIFDIISGIIGFLLIKYCI